MWGKCREAWFKIFEKQNRNIIGFQSHIWFWGLLLYKISLNKQIKLYKPYQWQSHQVLVSLHFLAIWPTVRRQHRSCTLRHDGMIARAHPFFVDFSLTPCFICWCCRHAWRYSAIHTKSQRPRIDLNNRFLPRPNTTTAWKLLPHRSYISKNYNPTHWKRFY